MPGEIRKKYGYGKGTELIITPLDENRILLVLRQDFPNTENLLKNLQSEGIPPEDIDTVIPTHGHPNDIGGIIIGGKLAFPNARFIM